MSKPVLTDITLKKLTAPASGQVEIWDGKIPGFGVRVSSAGTKSFVVFYRHAGRLRRLTLGRYPVLSLADARLMAMDTLNKAAHGEDPQPEQKIEIKKTYAFRDAVASFIELHCARHNREITRRDTERILRNRFISAWGATDIREIGKDDVNAVLDGIVASGLPSAANHALSAIRKFFNWCVERGLLNVSPCVGIKKPSKDRSRNRVLEIADLATLWNACEKFGYPFGPYMRLLILTAQRRNEVASMRWPDIDLQARTWTLPPEFAKNDQEHVVPLTNAAVAILATLPRLDDVLVFPARNAAGKHFANYSQPKLRMEKFAGVSDWTLHDLRRSAATHMARLGVAPHIIERILNHITGTLGGVAGVYNRFHYLPEMRAALELWAAHFDKLTSPAHVAPQATAQHRETS